MSQKTMVMVYEPMSYQLTWYKIMILWGQKTYCSTAAYDT